MPAAPGPTDAAADHDAWPVAGLPGPLAGRAAARRRRLPLGPKAMPPTGGLRQGQHAATAGAAAAAAANSVSEASAAAASGTGRVSLAWWQDGSGRGGPGPVRVTDSPADCQCRAAAAAAGRVPAHVSPSKATSGSVTLSVDH